MDKVKQALKDFSVLKKFPTKQLHVNRNHYNLLPVGDLISKRPDVYADTDGNLWNKMPWYFTMFHNPVKNIKLIHYDITMCKNGVGSSEIIVPKKNVKQTPNGHPNTIKHGSWKIGSYNYRDIYTTSRWEHFVADVLPNVIYCKCVGS